MSVLLPSVLVLQVLSALGLIVLVLLQHGKGADMGAAFGSGASGSLFGASGSANFLSRTTAVMATVFFVCTLALAFLSNKRGGVESRSIMEQSIKEQSDKEQRAKTAPPSGDPAPSPPGSAPAAPAANSDASKAQVPPADAGAPKAGQGSDIPK